MRRIETVMSLALGLLLGLPALSAQAQEAQENTAFSGQRFFPAKTREGVIDTEWAGIKGAGALDVGFWLNYARNPVLAYTSESGSLDRAGGLVRDRLDGNLILSLAPTQWLQLGLDVGMTFYQGRADGIDVGPTNVPLADIQAAGISDVRALATVQFLRAERLGIDVSLLLPLSLPAGNSSDYLGDTGWTFSPGVAISREFDRGFRLAGNVGYRIRNGVETLNLEVDNQWYYRVGYAYRFDATGTLPLELAFGVSGEADGNQPFRESIQSPLELLGMARYDIIPSTQVFVGTGFGLGRGVGAPDYRIFTGIAYSFRDRDRDDDGILDSKDACPDDPEDRDRFEDADGCPDPDNDEDTILDEADECPNDLEDPDGFEDTNGCPDPDNDQDGVLDGDDRCPDAAGPKENAGCPDRDTDGDGIVDRSDQCPAEPEDGDGFEDEDGCPDRDNDGDGVLDTADGCPDEAGPVENRGCPDQDLDGDSVVDRLDNCPDEPGSVENHGCKKRQLVQITSERIHIKDRVYFQVGKARIKRRSHRLLLNVAAVLKSHPEIDRVIVEGHTDNRGSDALNERLSQQRADAVRKFLMRRGGIEANRVEAVGYGESRPIESNDTAKGRASNRRVEFTIPTGSGATE